MPILINKETGLAENLPHEHIQSSLQSETHEVPLVNEKGEIFSAPLADARNLIKQEGYSQPNPDQLKGLMDYAKFSSPTEQAKTFLEGAADAATFGLSTAAETALGVNPEDKLGRREVNPGAHMTGEAVGLTGSSAVGLGEGALIGKAGQLAARTLGLGAAEGALAKVGSAAVKNAVETALVTSGDEVSKMLAKDPSQSAESAMANITLNGLLGGAVIGGAFGSVSPLWKAASDNKVVKFLNVIRNKANGLEKDVLPEASIGAAANQAGIELDPMSKAALSSNPISRELFQSLAESTTKSGHEALETMNGVRKKAHDVLLSSLGKTPEQVDALENLSSHDIGSQLKDSLISQIKETIDPVAEKFNEIKNKFQNEEVSHNLKTNLANEISQFSESQGYGLLKGTQQGSLIQKVLDSIPNVKTLEDLRKLQSQIGEQTTNPELWGLGRGLKNIFRDVEENLITERLGIQAPELLADHQAARTIYRSAMQTLDQLNDRLHVGKYAGPDSFISALKEMNPEDILKRLTPKNDANLLELIQTKFPKTSNLIQDSFLNQALKVGAKNPEQGFNINPNSLFKAMDQWSPELKQFVISPEAQNQINAVRQLLEAIPKRMNPSGTAKTLDNLWSHGAGGAFSMVSLLTGHNPFSAYLIGKLGHYISREVPDAVKLATLKFLGSDLPLSGTGFKAMADFMGSAIKAERMIHNGVQSIFKKGAQVLPQAFEPDPKTREKLKKRLDELQTKPDDLLNTGGETQHYLPNESGALASVAARAQNYLTQLKPNTTPQGVLDDERKPSQVEESKYNRALDIANQPLIVLKHIKEGNLIPEDVQTIQAIYPALYSRLSQKITNQIIEEKSKGKLIPYSQRIAMSLFLGQPLDSSMTPQAIQMNQKPMAQNQNQQQPPSKHHSFAHLGEKTNLMTDTLNQSRERKRLQDIA